MLDYLWLGFSIVTTFYSYYWDVVIDWGLGQWSQSEAEKGPQVNPVATEQHFQHVPGPACISNYFIYLYIYLLTRVLKYSHTGLPN